MRFKIVIFIAVILLLSMTLISNSLIAQETGTVKLSYKIISSNNSGQTLSMLLKLKVQNTGSTPILGVIAKNTYTNNVVINAGQINIGDINPGQTVTSTDSFTMTMNTGAGQEPPQKEAIWAVSYTDVNGNVVVSEGILQ